MYKEYLRNELIPYVWIIEPPPELKGDSATQAMPTSPSSLPTHVHKLLLYWCRYCQCKGVLCGVCEGGIGNTKCGPSAIWL